MKNKEPYKLEQIWWVILTIIFCIIFVIQYIDFENYRNIFNIIIGIIFICLLLMPLVKEIKIFNVKIKWNPFSNIIPDSDKYKPKNVEELITKEQICYFHCFADIKSGHLEKSDNITVYGPFKDIFDTSNWGNPEGWIWRIYDSNQGGISFKWGTIHLNNPQKVELVIYHKALTDIRLSLRSSLSININNKKDLIKYLPEDDLTTSIIEITMDVNKSENVITLSSLLGTGLLHGLQKVEILYYK